jgi:hypothetical protein
MVDLDALYKPTKFGHAATSGLKVIAKKPIPKMLQISTSAPIA